MRTDKPELIQLLIDLGVDPKLVDSYGSVSAGGLLWDVGKDFGAHLVYDWCENPACR